MDTFFYKKRGQSRRACLIFSLKKNMDSQCEDDSMSEYHQGIDDADKSERRVVDSFSEDNARCCKDLELPVRIKRTPDKSLRQLAYIVLRSRHSLGTDDGSSYFVITPDFCKTTGCRRRRIYDVCNVLEGIGMFAWMPGHPRTYKVIGTQGVQQFIERILLDGVKALPCTFNRSTTNYVCDDLPAKKTSRNKRKKTGSGKRKRSTAHSSSSSLHQPPPWITMARGQDDRDRLKNMTRSVIYALVMELYHSRDEPWPKRDFVDWLAMQHGGSAENTQYQTVHRRAYDVLNVLEVVGLIRLTCEHSKEYRFCGYQQIHDTLLFPDEYQLKLVEKGSPPNSIRIPNSISDDNTKFAIPRVPVPKRTSKRVSSSSRNNKKICVGPPPPPPPRVSLFCNERWDYPVPPPPPMPVPAHFDMFSSSSSIFDDNGSSSSSVEVDSFSSSSALLVPFPWEELEIY